MKKVNKKAFSKTEFMIMLSVIAILIAIGSYIAISSSKSYNSFKTISEKFASAVAMYKDKASVQKNEYTLYEVEKAGYIGTLTSPFDKTVECNKYESYVTTSDNSKKDIVLICGEYLVEGTQGNGYKIYEITEWKETQEDTNEGGVLYNYKEEGKLVLDKYVPLRTFLTLYGENTGLVISKVYEANVSGRQVVNKMVYRNKNLVKEFK